MLKFLAFGLGTGAGVQAWRNYPADGPVTADSLAVVFMLGLVFAYLGGLWRSRGRGGAVAVASATATATAAAVNHNTVQLAVVVPGGGARPTGVGLPSDTAPWLAGATERPQISEDDFEGLDLSEVFPESTPEAAG